MVSVPSHELDGFVLQHIQIMVARKLELNCFLDAQLVEFLVREVRTRVEVKVVVDGLSLLLLNHRLELLQVLSVQPWHSHHILQVAKLSIMVLNPRCHLLNDFVSHFPLHEVEVVQFYSVLLE